ncbi:dynamin family protein [Actinophytocola oryzae]|uniref:dynamin family protein n=1 Tax=Actinophytocola oryzae TaxID=502181 RepID=UPI001062B530|nr:dynamin family protein [Actinophytocola oryzae]
MRTPPWLTVLDDTIAACITHHRSDLAGKLEKRRSSLLEPKLRVPVIGEPNQGKSQLVNALVNAEVCAVGDDVTTITPTTVTHSPTPVAALVTEISTSGRRAIGPSSEPARIPVPVDEVARRALAAGPAEAGGEVYAEVGLPRELLAAGLVLIDTPPVNSTGPQRTATTFAALASADAVLMISDATGELRSSELDLLKEVSSLCPVVTVVLTKIDIVPRWRAVAERNRARLAAAGLVRVKVVPVSATVRLAAARAGDKQLNEESGFGELVRTLSKDVLANSDAINRGATAVLAAQATKQLMVPLTEALTEVRTGEQGRAQVLYRAAQHRLDELRRRTTRWQTMLADEVADLISDVEYDLRDRTRKIIRSADEFFDVADPARTWDEFAEWLREALVETADVNFAWLVERFQWVAEKIARQVALEEAVPEDVATDGLLDHVGGLEPPRIEKFTIGQQVFVGLRGSYGGLLMFGLATTIAGLPLINPISLGAGAAFGAKSIWDERTGRLKRRQAVAKQAAQRHVDDFFLSYGKASKDTARQVQRKLRDHFQGVVERLQTGVAEQATAAKRAADAELAERRRRSQEIAAEVDRLVGLHKRIQALVGQSPSPKELTA